METFVPDINDPDFLRLQELIDSEWEAIYIDSTPNANSPQLECFNIVQKKVEEHGGQMILGWEIWKSDILIEAEAHAVWEDENKDLHDISPKQDFLKVDRILFIEDSRIKYHSVQIDNIRLKVIENTIADLLIDYYELHFHLLNKGERAHFKILDNHLLTQHEIDEIKYVEASINYLTNFIREGKNEKSLCFCGKGKIFKNCHRRTYKYQLIKLKY